MPPSPAAIRTARLDAPTTRTRDLADSLGIAEAELCAAHTGAGVTRIVADPDRLIPRLTGFGPVMALTRNDSCVIEKVGIYDDYRPGAHAALVVNHDIDLRLFPAHWVHGFALEEETATGVKRSIQVFDAAGDAVHKIHLRAESDASGWGALLADLRLPDQGQTLTLGPRPFSVALADSHGA